MRDFERKLLIILPISRKGHMPERALKSIKPIKDQICLVASFNRDLDESCDEYTIKLLNDLNAIIFFTHRRLSLIDHINFILSNTRHKTNISKDTPTTILSDDDELLLNDGDVNEIITNIYDKIAVWGPYEIFDQSKAIVVNADAFYSSMIKSSYSRIERIQDEMKAGLLNWKTEVIVQGSISGLFAPFDAFSSALTYFSRTGSVHGARIEVSILAKQGLQVRRFTENVSRIYMHYEQTGKKLSSRDYIADEIRFRSYALLNAESFQELLALFRNSFGLRFFVKAVFLLTYRKISNMLK